MMNPGKELDSSSEISIISFGDIISQLNPVIWLAEKTLTIEYAPAGRSNFLIKETQGNAEPYNQLIRLFSYQVIDYREQTVEEEAPAIRFYGMIVSLMARNIVSLIFQALTYTGGGIIAN
jgi:hypothetical protein